MQLNAFKQFNLELDRIELLYQATMFSYKTTIEALEDNFLDCYLDESNRISISESNEETLLSKKKLKSKYGKKLPKEIAELVFIRIISVLEVFMISQIRELFLVRTDLFHSEDKINFSRGELLNSATVTELWEKLIRNELRNLQNQPLNKKSKYFSKYLNINFDNSPEYPLPLEHIHDMRHLIVHRLGKTDDQFRKKYRTPDLYVTVNPDDLEKAINSIRSFGKFIFEQSSSLLDDQVPSGENYEALAKIKVLRERVLNVFEFDYKFIDGESLIWCSDFIKKIHEKNGLIEIEMQGNKDTVISYLKLMKKLESGGSIDIISLSPESWREYSGIPGRRLSEDELKVLAMNLPQPPWQKDIHKRVATQLDTSNNVVSNAINTILEDPDLNKLLGEDVKYS